MLWLLLIIGAVFLFSFSNIFDKLLVEKYVKNPLLSVVACNVFFAPVLFLALVLWPPALLDHQSFLLLSLSTFLSLLGGLIYYKIVKSIEISRVIIVLQSAPVFILLLAVLILGERPSFINVFGVFSIVLASILVSKNSKGDGLRSNFWLIAAMCGSFMFAVYFSSLKFLLLKYDAWSIFLWNLLIALGFIVAASPLYFDEFFENLRNNPRLIKIAFLSQIFFFFGHVMRLNALRISEAALVGAIGGLQPLFVFGISYALSVFRPQALKESFEKRALVLKAAGAVLAAIGVTLVAL